MKHFQNKILTLLLMLTSLFTLSACDEEDWWAIDTINGSWRVVSTDGYYMPPYQNGDIFYFSPSGDFEARGAGGLNEYGYWEVQSRRILITFDHSGSQLSAYIRQLDDQYMELDVTDYDYNQNYTLRLVRYSYY